ncbi:MAG: hypothetical protein BroJett040_11310 [Oligoflexia bacterium]|nr:MAG: hypothetical protein BroJett040_11310 [Oligoflexia bacterium]
MRMRLRCPQCLQPDFSCYCALIKPFDPGMVFVILTHPIEIARRIATGRMSHLCLKNSHWIGGHDFTNNESVNLLLQDPKLHPVLLYPGPDSRNMSLMSEEEKFDLTPSGNRLVGKKLAIFVIDGTWHTARKMVRLSQNLKDLPRICFTPDRPSNFRIRHQPRPECYSTIEAIHQTIDLLSPPNRNHDHLLEVFDKMVNRQLELAYSLTVSSF